MLKYVTTLLIVISIITSLSFAQTKKIVKEQTMRKMDLSKVDNQSSALLKNYQPRKVNTLGKASGTAQDLMYAAYDWIYNGYAPNMLVMYDLNNDGVKDPIAIGTDYAPLTGTPVRHAMIAYIDEFGSNSYALYGTKDDGTYYKTGSNSMIILDEKNSVVYPCVYDALSGVLYNSLWAIDLSTDITAPTKVTTEGYSGGWPRMTLIDNGVFFSVDDNTDDLNFRIMKSTDGGVTFDSVTIFGAGDAGYWFSSFGGTEDPLIEGNGSKLSVISGIERNGAYNGYGFYSSGTTDADSANVIYHYYSTDAGATWAGETIEVDGVAGQVSNRPNMWATAQWWDVGDYTVDGSGVTHLVHVAVNSVDVSGAGDTISVFPILYWNDRDKNWIAITDTVLDYNYPIPDDGSFSYPANMLACSSPTIATSDDGEVVAAVWVIPEYSGELGNSDINYYPGDGGSSSAAVYYTDLVYAYSSDGGKTWSTPELLEDQKNYPEQWPILSPKVEVDGGQATINYMYYMDALPGSALVSGDNSLSADSKWVYNSKTFALGAVSVNDDKAIVKNYSLEQNYPNPFNPSTEIKFTLAKSGNVSLKIFDILGREVASLVNGQLEAGSHSVNFNAANLSSGVYMYTISADNFSMTKKMMLMK